MAMEQLETAEGIIGAESETKIDAKVEELKQQKELETKTQAKLDAVFNKTESQESTSGDDEDEQAEESEKSDESIPAKTADESEESDEANPDESDDSQTDDKGEEGDDTAAKATPEALSGIPGVYYRAAKHQQWTDEQIEAFYEKDPELCLSTLQTLHANQNNLSRQFAALGRERVKQTTSTVEKPVEKPVEKTTSVDISRLEEAYGEDPIVDVVKALLKQNEELLGKVKSPVAVAPVNESELRERQREIANTEKEIDLFFASPELKAYEGFYGAPVKSWNELDPKSYDNRWSVIKMADEIIAGAESLGEKVSVEEALQRAHAVVGEPIREKIVRSEIKNKAVKRSKGLSLAPTSGKPGESGKPTTKEDLEAMTEKRLAKVFNK